MTWCCCKLVVKHVVLQCITLYQLHWTSLHYLLLSWSRTNGVPVRVVKLGFSRKRSSTGCNRLITDHRFSVKIRSFGMRPRDRQQASRWITSIRQYLQWHSSQKVCWCALLSLTTAGTCMPLAIHTNVCLPSRVSGGEMWGRTFWTEQTVTHRQCRQCEGVIIRLRCSSFSDDAYIYINVKNCSLTKC